MAELTIEDPVEFRREVTVDDYGRINVGTKYSGQDLTVVLADGESEVKEPESTEAPAND
jgi:hypothetical protein